MRTAFRFAILLCMTSLSACAGEAIVSVDAGPRTDAQLIDSGGDPDGGALDLGADASTITDSGTPTDSSTPDMLITVDGGGATFPIRSGCAAFAGGSPNGECVFPSPSADGRFIAFASDATDLLETAFPASPDLSRFYVRDTMSNMTELVSYNASGAAAGTPYNPTPPSISSDGRFVIYAIPANEWDSVTYSSPNPTLLILRDRTLNTSTVVSQKVSGEVYDGTFVQIAGNGQSFALQSSYALTAMGSLGFDTPQVFVRDLSGDGDAIEKVSIGFDDLQASGFSYQIGDVSISDDGHRVVFNTNADNFITGAVGAGVPAYMKHCYMRDLNTDTTTRLDVATVGTTDDWPDNECNWAVISGNGQFVVFSSAATNIVAGDTNGFDDLFLRDLNLNTTVRITLSDSGAEITDSAPTATATIIREFDVSDDGAYVVFLSFSHTLIAGDTAVDAGRQAFLRDIVGGHTYRYTLHPDGSEFTDSQAAFIPRISGDGSLLIFTGSRAGIIPGSGGSYELFLVPRSGV